MSTAVDPQTQRKLENFEQALAALTRFLAEPNRSEAAEAGIVKAFELTFEQAWKLVQRVAEQAGLPTASPKAALRAGLRMHLVGDESLWLAMLDDRNLAAHTYRPGLARSLVERIEQRYAGELRLLRQRIGAHLAAG